MQKQQSFSLEGLKIAIAIPCYSRNIILDSYVSLQKAMFMLRNYKVSVTIITETENAIITVARDRLVHKFLTQTDCNRLFWLDDDLDFDPSDLVRLAAWSTQYSFVAAGYVQRQYPLAFNIKVDLDNPVFNEHGLLKIASCGLGFCITDRSIYERWEGPYYKMMGERIKNIFNTAIKDENFYGEDYLFMQTCGEDIWLDPSIKLTHFGNHGFEGRFADLLEERYGK